MSVIAIPKSLREVLGEEGTSAFVEIIKSVSDDTNKGLASKEDLTKIALEMAELRSEIKLLKWMVGAILAGVVSLILKSFFIS